MSIENPELLLVKRQQLRLRSEKVSALKRDGLQFYRPHPKQDAFHRAGGHFKRRMLRAGNRFGKALRHSTPVLTPTGWVPISGLEIGDQVFDGLGQLTTVTGVFPQGKKHLLRHNFDDETFVDSCKEHLWLCKSPKERWRGQGFIVRSTEQIIRHVGPCPTHAKQRYSIPLCSSVEFPEQSLPLDPYVLGVLLGDGGMTTKSVTLTSFDEEIVRRFFDSLPFGCLLKESAPGNFVIVGSSWHNTGLGRVSNNPIPDILAKLDLFGRASNTKFIPNLYKFAPAKHRLALLQGLLDTDGYAGPKSVEYSTMSPTLCADVLWLVQSLGFTASFNKRTTSCQTGASCLSYRVLVHRPTAQLFHLSRKRNVISTENKKLERVLYRIEDAGHDEAVCITVASAEQTFIVNDCIVTHNSLMGCAEDCAWIRNERVWLPESDPDRRSGIPQHPVKLLTITTDWDKVDEIFTSQRGEGGKVWRFLPRDGFVKSVRRNHSGAIDTIECANNSVWRFDTAKSWLANPQGSESSDWDAIHIDEPCPEGMWKAASRGLVDRGGSAWFTLTPLTEFWISDYFFPTDTGGQARDNVWSTTGTIYDNPYLNKEAIAEYALSLTDDEAQCRLYGIPLHLSGLIYKQFVWDTHVLKEVPSGWDSFFEPPKNWPIYFAIDPHPQTPHAVLFATVLPTGQRIYLFDIFRHCSVDDLSEEILAYTRGRNVVWSKIDPLAKINDPITETSMLDEFAKNGIFCDVATKALAQGILRVQGNLKKRDLFFSPSCRRTLWEIQRYAWDEKENKPIDKDDHMMENLYRLELSEPRFVVPDESRRTVPDLVIDRPELNLDPVDLTSLD